MITTFPSPAGQYDRENEAQFRAAVARGLQDAGQGTSTGGAEPAPHDHDDRYYTEAEVDEQVAAAAGALATHAVDTTSVHGIADTSVLETTSGAQSKADVAQATAEANANTYTDGEILSVYGTEIETFPTNAARGDVFVGQGTSDVYYVAAGLSGRFFKAAGTGSLPVWAAITASDVSDLLSDAHTWADSQIFSAVASFQGVTVPFVVVGSDQVDNLNANYLQGEAGDFYLDRGNHSGTQTAATISDFAAAVRALVSVSDGTNIDLTYTPGTGVITASITGTLARGNLPSQIAYEDEANTFSQDQAITRSGANAMLNLTRASGVTMYLQAQASVGILNSNASSGGAAVLRFSTGGAGKWEINTSGHFIASTDAVTDFGDASHRIRDLFLSRNASIDGALDHNGATVGFFGATPATRSAAYTQTYATADRIHAARTAAALTDNVAGSVGTTLAAIPDPADTPLTADALRDDLVLNVLPKIRDALSSLADQVNKGRVDALDTAQAFNSACDDLQLYGLFQ